MAKEQETGRITARTRRRTAPPSFLFRPVHTRLIAELLQPGLELPKLVSLVAPVGYGKTVTMSELYLARSAAGVPCFWIGLDERDTAVERVIRTLHQALASASRNLDPIQALLHGDVSLEERIDDLLDLIAALPESSTIFIDNLNSCTDETLGMLCDALIFDTPASIHLVWSSSTELSYNLGRAKLEGLVRQVGLTDMSLGMEEVQAFLGTDMARDIGESGVAEVARQTEGWPAAVRMAQIVLRQSDRPSAALHAFSGTHSDLAALLNQQVLRGYSPELREFLLCLGLLRYFNMELCRKATGLRNAEQHLEFLLRHNVFIVPLDRNREFYRLHGLLRDFLQGEAKRSLPEERRQEVLRNAAEWSMANGEWRDAIDYAVAAGEYAMASEVMERAAALLLHDRGDIAQYIEWIEDLRAMKLEIGWEAQFWYVWGLIFHRRYETGRIQQVELARRLEACQQAGLPVPAEMPQRIEYLGICLDLLTDRLEDTYQRTERWLALDNTSDAYVRNSVTGLRCICDINYFRLAKAREVLGFMRPIMREISGAYTMGWIGMTLSCLLIQEGDFAAAHAEVSNSLAVTRESLGPDVVLCDTLALVAAKCALEVGRHDEARDLLRSGLRTIYSHGLLDSMLCGFDAAIGLWNGYDDALVSIVHLREIAYGYPQRLGLTLSCLLVRRLLKLGRLLEAEVEARQVGLGDDGAPDAEQLAKPCYRDLWQATEIELLIARGRHRKAETLIEQSMREAQTQGRFGRQVELHLVRMGMAMHVGNTRLAARELALAVTLAAPRGMVRPFLDNAGTIANLVNDTKASAWGFVLPEERAFFFRICSELPVGNSLAHELMSAREAEAVDALVLTRRERELLILLDIGLSNQAIAERTETSIGTIKWHLKNLYRKLGVSSRSAALARARTLQLLAK
ncbi:MAG TPA: LuxR C-terminal-related transcriptional regulator [Macromonas sp.]|nr:LuxR C-terminal-related transcriptional regulator [Macromonas sp.]